MYKLIVRTKESVRHVDHQNFKRLQKMLMGVDEAESDTTSVDIESEPPRYVHVYTRRKCVHVYTCRKRVHVHVYTCMLVHNYSSKDQSTRSTYSIVIIIGINVYSTEFLNYHTLAHILQYVIVTGLFIDNLCYVLPSFILFV